MTRTSRRAGKISVAGVVMVVAAVAGIYFGFMYLPVLMHRMSISDVAREAAAKMMVEGDDYAIRNWVFEEVKKRSGVQVSQSEMFLRRDPDMSRAVTVRWTEQVKHLWGKNHVIKMEVTQTVKPGGVHMKNAN